VVNLIIQMLLDADQHEQATALLIHMSQYTVGSLLLIKSLKLYSLLKYQKVSKKAGNKVKVLWW